jgi:hypothetical protein
MHNNLIKRTRSPDAFFSAGKYSGFWWSYDLTPTPPTPLYGQTSYTERRKNKRGEGETVVDVAEEANPNANTAFCASTPLTLRVMNYLEGPPQLVQHFGLSGGVHIGARALHVLNLIRFGYIACLSQWGGGGG